MNGNEEDSIKYTGRTEVLNLKRSLKKLPRDCLYITYNL